MIGILTAVIIATSTSALPPPPPGYVLDETGKIPVAMIEKLQRQSYELNRDGAGVITVIFTNDLRGRATRKEFVIDLLKHWQVGHKGKDDGIVVLAKTEQPLRGVEIEVGYGLEGALNDGKVGSFIREAIPTMKSGDWGTGISQISINLGREMRKEVKVTPGIGITSTAELEPLVGKTRDPQDTGSWLGIVLSAAIVFMSFYGLLLFLLRLLPDRSRKSSVRWTDVPRHEHQVEYSSETDAPVVREVNRAPSVPHESPPVYRETPHSRLEEPVTQTAHHCHEEHVVHRREEPARETYSEPDRSSSFDTSGFDGGTSGGGGAGESF